MYKYLAAYRDLANISQSEIARVLNIYQSSYSMKENGKNKFSVDEALRVYEYINSRLEIQDRIPFEKMFKKC